MLEEKIKTFVERINSMKNNILTEEATKTSLIMPFFALLGYDVFNPLEFVPEYTADVKQNQKEKKQVLNEDNSFCKKQKN